MTSSDTQPPTPAPEPPAVGDVSAEAVLAELPHPPLTDDELIGLEQELSDAFEGLLATIASWLSEWWEQPILQVLTRNPNRSLQVADTFPHLKQTLRGLQAGARASVDASVAPVITPAEVNPTGQFTETVNTPLSHLLGLIGQPLIDAGFAPASVGFDRGVDGFRLRNLPEHGEVAKAAIAYRRAAERVSDKRQQLERDEQARLRTEVEDLWAKA